MRFTRFTHNADAMTQYSSDPCVHRNQIHVVRETQRGAVSDDLRMNIQIVRRWERGEGVSRVGLEAW